MALRRSASTIGRSNFLDCFLIVTFDPNEKSRTKIRFQFPSTLDKIISKVPSFCWPELTLSPDLKETEDFCFVLTIADGTNRFGFCRRHAKNPKDHNSLPVCYCLISAWSSWSVFKEVMDVIDLFPNDDNAVLAFVTSLQNMNFPSKGETIVVETNGQEALGKSKYRMTRSETDLDYLEFVVFEPLFNAFSIEDLLYIFNVIMNEGRIIGVGNSLSNVTACMIAMSFLAYPFSWQFVFVPILPLEGDTITFVEAPVPFLIGMLDVAVPEFDNRHIEKDTVILNLDTGQFMRRPVFKHSLPGEAKSLKEHLEKLKNSGHRGLPFNKAVANCFLVFWAKVFYDYQKYFKNNSFDMEGFIASKTSKHVKSFLKGVAETQMFYMFMQERVEMLTTKGNLNDCILAQTAEKISHNTEIKKRPKAYSSGSPMDRPSSGHKTRRSVAISKKTGDVPPQNPITPQTTLGDVGELLTDESSDDSSPLASPHNNRELKPKKDNVSYNSRDTTYLKKKAFGSIIKSKAKKKAKKAGRYITETTRSYLPDFDSDESDNDTQSSHNELNIKRGFGLGQDVESSILKSMKDKERTITIKSLDRKEFTIYQPFISKRFPRINKYQRTDPELSYLPLHHDTLLTFLKYIHHDEFHLSALLPERIIDLIKFCGDDAPKLRYKCLTFIRRNLNEDNFMEFHEKIQIYLNKQPSNIIMCMIVEELKLYFVRNWKKIIFSVPLQSLPGTFLAKVMSLKDNITKQNEIQAKLDTFYEKLHNEAKVDELSKTMSTLYKNKYNSDIIFILGEGKIEIPAHRYILTANSPQLKFPLEEKIPIQCAENHFERFLSYLYFQDLSEFPLTSIDEILPLWQIGCHFLSETEHFEDKLLQWLGLNLSPKNVFKFLDEVEKKSNLPLPVKDYVIQYIAENITTLVKMKEFSQLSKPTLVAIFQKVGEVANKEIVI